MCCDGYEIPACEEYGESFGECPDCGEKAVVTTEADGSHSYQSARGCNWSPIACSTCGWRPCDGSC